MHKHLLRNVLLASATALALSACGGGGGDGGAPPVVTPTPGPTTDVPTSAMATTDGLLAYVKTLLGMTSETGEPVVIGDIALPTDDTAPPAPVN